MKVIECRADHSSVSELLGFWGQSGVVNYVTTCANSKGERKLYAKQVHDYIM